MHVSTQGRSSLSAHPLPIPKRFCMLGQLMQREEVGRKKSSSSFLCFTSWGGVSDSGTPDLKHSSAPISVSSNKRHGETTRLFSVITQKSLPILEAPRSRFECKWTLESKFPINICMYHTDEQEREMIGSEIGSGFESLTIPLFQPTTHTHTPFLTGQFSNIELQRHGWSHTQCII